jgi:hypothetical protein
LTAPPPLLPKNICRACIIQNHGTLHTGNFAEMKEPGLDGRHRDRDGRISEKHGNTLNKNLSKPIPQFGPDITLATMREKTGQTSERGVRKAAVKIRR